MIVVILGGNEQKRSKVISQFLQGERSLVQHLSVEPLSLFKGSALLRLKAMFDNNNPTLTNTITVVSGITKQNELNYLRKKKALVCHCYGHLSNLYDQLVIERNDLFVMPEPLPKTAPVHVLCPSEVLSESFCRG